MARTFNEEKIQATNDKYEGPENITNLMVPRLNPEILKMVQSDHWSNDIKHPKLERGWLNQSAVLTIQAADILTETKLPDQHHTKHLLELTLDGI